MREVVVPTGFAAQMCRRAVVLIATCLVVLQAFLAGVAAAQAAAITASPDPIGAICHGSGGGGGADGTAPKDAELRHLCCACCASALSAIVPPAAPCRAQVRHDPRPVLFSRFIFVISPGAIRAGASQAPPRLA